MSERRIISLVLEENPAAQTPEALVREREVAVADLIAGNHYMPVAAEIAARGPFALKLALAENRLRWAVHTAAWEPLESFETPVMPLKPLIRDYFDICEVHYHAVKDGMAHRIEAVDMGRRGIHNAAAEQLMEMLEFKAEIDFETARRLFTLLCALSMKEPKGGMLLRHPI